MWYGIGLLFKSKHVKQNEEPVWEEIVVVLEADSEAVAMEKATKYAAEHVVEYDVADGDTVSWTFEEVSAVTEIDSVFQSSGTEVFSRFLKDKEVKSLRSKFD